MNHKTWITLIIGASLFGAFIVGVLAPAIQAYFYPQTTTVGPKLAIYIGDTEWLNGTLIDWGSLEADESYELDLNVINLSNGPVTVMLEVTGLFTGWTETWTKHDTLLAFEGWANGTLTLTIPYGAPLGDYSWGSYIKGEYT